ncbi:hypothetical protein GU3_09515 [Oceanimonas sp. GK1]|uniref:hypothetical protein n=1 Tax=Oceanimonas sp. (strain GK1 / IBRC-M 10197) TaxID=511062 RepID=UPI0002494E3A|nr:hypothetical protein [Oceanimonas sp. GK1]AEY01659.1 hypothetical protein GU3_09515 [Oceanimonas sp. GK1]
MKTVMSVMLAAVFALSMVPLHTSAATASQPVADTLSSRGDGADNRQCRMMEKQGKKLPGFCRP